MSQPTLKITSDFTAQFNAIVKQFKNDEVLVGIPESETDRDESEPITNAALLAINHFGSPANNIPARPVMTIGIRNAQPELAAEFRKAAVAALTKGVGTLHAHYERAGIIASMAVKKAINSQEGILPPADATLARRKSAGFRGTKALIVTAQMRNAITYVVKGKS